MHNFSNLPKDVLNVVKPPFWVFYSYVNITLRKAYETAFTKFLDKNKSYTLFDYGCGIKPYEYLLKDYCNSYIGADIGNNPKAEINIKPGGNVPVENSSFDIVLSSQVLEHVEDVFQYLNECNRVLKKGGLLFLSTHGTWQYHSSPIDVQRWTSYGLKKLVEGHQFEIIGFIPVLGQLALTSQLRLTFYDSFANMFGVIGKILLLPVSIFYQLKMRLEDLITPSRVKDRDSAVYIVIAKKKL
jgi:SAM-dependent methyltransferase